MASRNQWKTISTLLKVFSMVLAIAKICLLGASLNRYRLQACMYEVHAHKKRSMYFQSTATSLVCQPTNEHKTLRTTVLAGSYLSTSLRATILGLLDPVPTWYVGWRGRGCCPHNTKQSSDTRRVSEYSTQFWHYQSWNSIRFHRLNVQSYKTPYPLPSDTSPKPKVVTYTSDGLTINQRFPGHPPQV